MMDMPAINLSSINNVAQGAGRKAQGSINLAIWEFGM